jgi:aromatic-L-amino-acid decarboxylase
MPYPLEPDGDALRRRLRLIGDKLGRFIDGLPAARASNLRGSRKLASTFDEPMPEQGRPLPHLLSRILDRAVPAALDTAGPGYLGFVPGGGLVDGVLADLISGITNRYTGLWMPTPGLVQAEISVIRWLLQLVGYPGGGGVLLSGGSIANLTALVAAREDRLGDRIDDGVVYVSSFTHHCVRKAARIAGLRHVREVPVDGGFRLRADAVRSAMEEDRAAGLRPFAVVASAGTTALGVVDPLSELADLCSEQSVWLHIDGAYGGCFALTERGRATLEGMGRADSVVLDPHKGLFLHYGTGALLVRDRATLRRAFTEPSSYLPDASVDPDRWDFADLGPELSRPVRGLRLWLPLQLHGVAAFRDALDEKLDLARAVHEALRAWPEVRIVTPPTLSLLTFRVELGWTETRTDALNRRWIARTNDRGRVFLTGATIEEEGAPRFVVRVCVLAFRTHADRIDALLEDLRSGLAAARLELETP